MVMITTSAVLPQLRPPPCPTQENCQEASNKQLSVLYAALLLTSLGTGGLRPCVVTFAADQFDMSKMKTESGSWNFFNWYYFCMGVASLLALTVVVYIQDNVSWAWGLGIPTIAVGLSVVVFILGSSLYKKIKPGGSIYESRARNPVGVTCLQRMGIGFGINIFATIASALIEIKRKAVAADNNLLDKPTSIIPISVFWLVPQYYLHGLAEVFMSVGHLEFLYDQSPESMRSTAAALFWIATAMGNYMSTFMVTLVHKYTGEKRNWLPDRNLNRGRLENYYWLMTGIQVINLIYYVICAWFYKYKPINVISETGISDEDVESANNTKPLSSNDAKEDKQVELVRT
ncbi:UNVERIFIED_CONTAM: protein NRT1/ PTR FAMILY 3.1 [Sesamum radiatum]|uniref:Protein NRT1/ PTR FAMILY 3.1 n=1 Tax=Sesamum radiatum TaxID=300843 RepID=A0AAW2NA74_SESRA